MRILAIGEGMVEFTRSETGWTQAYGGDTLNTAVHLSRLGANVAFASVLGVDPFSHDLRSFMERERIDTGNIGSDPNRQCGIYFIATAPDGERSFTYWRSHSAARGTVRLLGDELVTAMLGSDLVYLSLISLAILPEEDRALLLEMATYAIKAGARIAFDSNYRPVLWEDVQTAAKWSARFSAIAEFGLPTLEDEQALGTASQPQDVARAWAERGCAEVVLKMGARGCLLPGAERPISPPQTIAVDTSGAGDSFNAAYLWNRLTDHTRQQAALRASRLAAWVVGQKGAIPLIDALHYQS